MKSIAAPYITTPAPTATRLETLTGIHCVTGLIATHSTCCINALDVTPALLTTYAISDLAKVYQKNFIKELYVQCFDLHGTLPNFIALFGKLNKLWLNTPMCLSDCLFQNFLAPSLVSSVTCVDLEGLAYGIKDDYLATALIYALKSSSSLKELFPTLVEGEALERAAVENPPVPFLLDRRYVTTATPETDRLSKLVLKLNTYICFRLDLSRTVAPHEDFVCHTLRALTVVNIPSVVLFRWFPAAPGIPLATRCKPDRWNQRNLPELDEFASKHEEWVGSVASTAYSDFCYGTSASHVRFPNHHSVTYTAMLAFRANVLDRSKRRVESDIRVDVDLSDTLRMQCFGESLKTSTCIYFWSALEPEHSWPTLLTNVNLDKVDATTSTNYQVSDLQFVNDVHAKHYEILMHKTLIDTTCHTIPASYLELSYSTRVYESVVLDGHMFVYFYDIEDYSRQVLQFMDSSINLRRYPITSAPLIAWQICSSIEKCKLQLYKIIQVDDALKRISILGETSQAYECCGMEVRFPRLHEKTVNPELAIAAMSRAEAERTLLERLTDVCNTYHLTMRRMHLSYYNKEVPPKMITKELLSTFFDHNKVFCLDYRPINGLASRKLLLQELASLYENTKETQKKLYYDQYASSNEGRTKVLYAALHSAKYGSSKPVPPAETKAPAPDTECQDGRLLNTYDSISHQDYVLSERIPCSVKSDAKRLLLTMEKFYGPVPPGLYTFIGTPVFPVTSMIKCGCSLCKCLVKQDETTFKK